MSSSRSCKVTMAMVSILMLLTIRCNPDEESKRTGPLHADPLKPKPAVSTTVMGVIIDEHGQPVADAEVNIHGEATLTGTEGTFFMTNIQVPGNRCVVQATKEGYFTGTRALTPNEDGTAEVRIILMASPVTHSFDASTGTNAALADGSEVHIPPGGLITQAGTDYSGPVNMSVRYLDPTAGNFGVLVPGGDMVARREDESSSILYSYGILRVLMTDLAGEALQLAAGSSSTLIMNIPEEQLSTAPEQVPLWYFDEEDAVWQEEGVALRQNNRYVGKVTHFTDWNCDAPTGGATIIGRLVDCEYNPAYGVVEFGQVTSDPRSSTTTGETDGRFSRRVPSGVPITVTISDPLVVTPLTKSERGKVIVVVPPLAPGQVYDVGDIQTFPCASSVIGSFKTAPEDEVLNVIFTTEKGCKPYLVSGNAMNTTLPPDMGITMTVNTRRGVKVVKAIQSAGEGEVLDLGEINLTSSLLEGNVPIIGKTECFGRAEVGGQISASWSDDDMGTGINYSSPMPDGTFSVQAPLNTTVELVSSTPNGNWVRTVQTPAHPDEVVDLGTIELCESADIGETSFKVTGDGMENTLVPVISNKNWSATNMGLFYPWTDMTLVMIEDKDNDVTMSISFPGDEPGPRTALNTVMITIERKVGDNSVYYWGALRAENTTIRMNITTYEDVGGAIEGTFSGTFDLQDADRKSTGATVQIKEGKFSVKRYPDVE